MADVYDQIGGFVAGKIKSSVGGAVKGAAKGLTGAMKRKGKTSKADSSKAQQLDSNGEILEKVNENLGQVNLSLQSVNQSLQNIVKSSAVLPTMNKELNIISRNVRKIPQLIKKQKTKSFFDRMKARENRLESDRGTAASRADVSESAEDQQGSKDSKSTTMEVLKSLIVIKAVKFIAQSIFNLFKKLFKVGGTLGLLLLKGLRKALFLGVKALGSIVRTGLKLGRFAITGKGLIVFAIVGLIKGIYDGFTEAKEGQVFSVREAFNGFIQLLTLGGASEEFANKLYDSIGGVFNKIKSFFASIFGQKIEPKESSGRPKGSRLGSSKNTGVNQQAGPDFSKKGQGATGEKTSVGDGQSGAIEGEGPAGNPVMLDPITVTPEPGFDPSNMVKTSTAPSQAPSQGDSMRAGLGNFMKNTGATDMLGNNIMPMMGKMKGGGNVNKGDMMKKGFSSMFGSMGKDMGVDAGAVTGDLKGGIQSIKSAKGEDKQAALMGALGDLANNPAIKNFKGKESTEESRAENIKNVSGGLDSLIGGTMSGMGLDTKSLQDQYGNQPMAPGSGGSSPSIYDSGKKKAPSGAEMSDYSQAVSDGQRMEGASKGGGIQVNSKTFNNDNKGKIGGNKKAPPVVNTDLFKQINLPGGFAI